MATRRNTVDSPDLNTALGGALVSTDTAILDRFSTTFSTNTSKPAVNLQKFLATKDFTGNFSAASPLNIQCNQSGSEFIINFGGDWFYLTSNSGAGTIKLLKWNPQKGSAQLILSEAIVPDFYGSRANVLVADSVDMGNCYADGQQRMLITKSANALTLIETRGQASIDLQRDFADAVVAGGEIRVNDIDCAAGDVVIDGGTYRLLTCASHGAITGKSGVLDASNLGVDMAITGVLGPGLKILLPAGDVELDYSACTYAPGGKPDIIRQK